MSLSLLMFATTLCESYYPHLNFQTKTLKCSGTSQPSELMGNRSKICIQTQSAMPRVSICAWKADSIACAPPCDLMILTTCGGRIGEGNGTPLQYSCLENPMDGGAWKAAVHGVAEGQARLSDFTFTFHFHALEKEMATHSSVLAWRIPGMGSHKVGYD